MSSAAATTGSRGGGTGASQKRWEDLTPQEQEAAARWWQNYAACLAAQASATSAAAAVAPSGSAAKPFVSVAPSPGRPTKAAVAATKAALAPESRPLPPSVAALTPAGTKKHSKYVMAAAGITWEDPSLDEWPENDFRLFVGDLGNDCTDAMLAEAFQRYESFQRARVIKDRRSGFSKGYGFVSFASPADFARALHEMNGKYCGSRPMKLRRSRWKDKIASAENLARRKDVALPPAIPRRMDLTTKGARRVWL